MSKVGISIGHGEDTYDKKGAKGIADDGTGKHWEEFWFNEAVGKRVYNRLKDHGFEVILPQKWDEDERSLSYKAKTFNNEKTDLNVCIHANAGPANAEGACVFYWNGSKGGKRFSDLWVDNFQELCPEQGLHGNGQHVSDYGKWTNFYMIRETDGYTALIEHGFFTTPSQLKNLKSPDFQRRSAEAIVKSVCEYFDVSYKVDTGAQSNTETVKEIDTVSDFKLSDSHAQSLAGVIDKASHYLHNEDEWKKKLKNNDVTISEVLYLYGHLVTRMADDLTKIVKADEDN